MNPRFQRKTSHREISDTAYAIWRLHEKEGLANDATGNWLSAERKCRSHVGWVRFWFFWGLKRYGNLFTACIAAFGLIANTLITFHVLGRQEYNAEITGRPYVGVSLERPRRTPNNVDSAGYGGNILFTNRGGTHASGITTEYYITTDVDLVNKVNKEWFQLNWGFYPEVTDLSPNGRGREPGGRALNPHARYYYFEAVSTYGGLGLHSRHDYWTHVRHVYRVLNDKVLIELPEHRIDEVDQNRAIHAPEVATLDEVTTSIHQTEQC